jgi:hypothetical protein
MMSLNRRGNVTHAIDVFPPLHISCGILNGLEEVKHLVVVVLKHGTRARQGHYSVAYPMENGGYWHVDGSVSLLTSEEELLSRFKVTFSR